MSFSVGVQATRENAVEKLEEQFSTVYSSPDPGVKELFSAGCDGVASFCNASSDEGNYSVSVSGHAQQADNESSRDSLSVLISPIV